MQEEFPQYDESQAIAFIRNQIPQELKDKLSDDEIIYIVDLIYDYYESRGFLDVDQDEEVEIDEMELLEYVVKNAKKDKVGEYTTDEIRFVVQGELDYCESIGIFGE